MHPREKLKKQWVPNRVEVNGDEFFIRPMRNEELSRMEKLPDDLKTAFILGCILFVDASGEVAFPKAPEMTDAEYAASIKADVCDQTFIPWMTALIHEANELQTVKKPEAITKN